MSGMFAWCRYGRNLRIQYIDENGYGGQEYIKSIYLNKENAKRLFGLLGLAEDDSEKRINDVVIQKFGSDLYQTTVVDFCKDNNIHGDVIEKEDYPGGYYNSYSF